MTPEEELAKALAEVEAAKRELAEARKEVADADSCAPTKRAPKKAAAKPKPKERPVPRSELRSECSGTGNRFPSDGKLRLDMTPVVAKDHDPMARPNEYKNAGIECLLVFDVKQGFMDSDSWKRCTCLDCVKST